MKRRKNFLLLCSPPKEESEMGQNIKNQNLISLPKTFC